MVLDPLTEVGIGMFVAIVIRRRQLMVHVLCDRKRGQHQQQQGQADQEAGTKRR